LKAVKSGKHQSDIMKQFKFSTAAQFKSHYLTALMEDGQAPAIVTTRASKSAGPAKEAFVSKRGSVVISKGLVAEMGFAEGDTFTVRKTKSGISLRIMD
jgi:preprotein translocase subunit SecA